ncbi:MAG: hypothetical protein R3F11_19070 [Verrucomicrobiales bacterium]
MKLRHLLTLFAFLSASAAACPTGDPVLHDRWRRRHEFRRIVFGHRIGRATRRRVFLGRELLGRRSGFWGGSGGAATGGYADWADANLPAGSDKSFGGDANNDGIPNGVHYAFGDTEVKQLGAGKATAPAGPVPADVILRWQFGSDLTGWETIAKWEGGVFSTLVPDEVSVSGGVITDTYRDPSGRGFYRWEATYLGS